MLKLLLIASVVLFGRINAQHLNNLDTIGRHSGTTNIYIKKLAGDSLSTSFFILIKKEVKPHYHAMHSEHVTIVDGAAVMQLANDTFIVKKSDVIFIPKNTIHAVFVKGKKPLKVLSIQSPGFDGSDRIMIE